VSYSESQYILRIHGTGQSFETVLLPYAKGTDRSTLAVNQDSAGNVIIQQGQETITIGSEFYLYQSSSKTVFASYATGTSSIDDWMISGGPMEIEVDGSQATVTFSGESGLRTFQAPDAWSSCSITPMGSALNYDYEDSGPVSITLYQGNIPPAQCQTLDNAAPSASSNSLEQVAQTSGSNTSGQTGGPNTQGGVGAGSTADSSSSNLASGGQTADNSASGGSSAASDPSSRTPTTAPVKVYP
jgi:hypothetical protein